MEEKSGTRVCALLFPQCRLCILVYRFWFVLNKDMLQSNVDGFVTVIIWLFMWYANCNCLAVS